MDRATPSLPDTLVVFDPKTDIHSRYTGDAGQPFVPVAGYVDEVDYAERDPSRSPDGQWQIRYDDALRRFVVEGQSGEVYPFAHYTLALSQIAWSPDSRYIAYRADSDDGSWSARIMIMTLADGTTQWIGQGDAPRWYSE